MRVATTIPATIEIGRRRLLGLVIGIAAVAAAISWALTTYAGAGDTAQHTGSPRATAGLRAKGTSAPARASRLLTLSPQERRSQERRYLKAMTAVCSVVMCPPNEQLQFAARLGFTARK